MNDRPSYLLPAACALALHSTLFFGFPSARATPLRVTSSPHDTPDTFVILPEPPPHPDDDALPSPADASRRGETLPSIEDNPAILKPHAFIVRVDARPSVLPAFEHPTLILPGSPTGDADGTIGGSRPLVDARFLDSPPRARSQIQPLYPARARSDGVTGKVLVDFVVDTAGHVSSASIVRSTNPVFDSPTLRAVRSWNFEPGLLHGKPTSFRMRIPIVFSLNAN